MENKDIDNYFKDRSDTFNEAPGEALWAKIEANIEAPATPGRKGGKWLLGLGGMAILSVAAWLLMPRGKDVPQNPKVVKETVITAPQGQARQSAETSEDSIAATEVVVSTQVKKPAQNTVAVKKVAMSGALTSNSPNRQGVTKAASRHADMRTDANALAGYDIGYEADMIEMEVDEKLTPAERDRLINNTIEKNAPYVGRKIIISVKGYDVYQHTITAQDRYKHGGLPKDTVIKPKLNVEVVTDTLFYKLIKDSLTPDIIKFKGKER